MGKQGCEEGPGICSVILTLFSVILVIATLPFSLLFVVKVVQVRLVNYHHKICPYLSYNRNMKEQSYFAWVSYLLEEPEVQACSSFFHVLMFMRR